MTANKSRTLNDQGVRAMSETDSAGRYYPDDPDYALSNAELRVEIARLVGFDFQQRIDSRMPDSTSKHAIYFRAGDLVAILNYIRFRTEKRPEPVQFPYKSGEIVKELARHCEFEYRSRRMEHRELRLVLKTLRSLPSETENSRGSEGVDQR
jgi:hypothetical protein